MRSTLSSGTRVQYTQPPNGSLNGTPSSSTSVRLTPLGPMPRSDTPCVVGCDDRLLVRRNRLNVGICRSTSSATTAGDWRIVSRLEDADAGRHVADALLDPRCCDRDQLRQAGWREDDLECRSCGPGLEVLTLLGKSLGPYDDLEIAGR